MSYWGCVQLEPCHENFALKCLGQSGYEIYFPKIQQLQRRPRAPRPIRPLVQPLFPGYCFILIELGWYAARWSPGVIRLLTSGSEPSRVPDLVITSLRAREKNGFVVLPKPPGLVRGDTVRILHGPFTNQFAIYQNMVAKDRVAVLLTLLGGPRRIILAKDDIKASAET